MASPRERLELARKRDGQSGQRTRSNRAGERYGRKRLKSEAAKRGEKRSARESRPTSLQIKGKQSPESDKRLSAQILCRNHSGKQVEKATVERGQETGRGAEPCIRYRITAQVTVQVPAWVTSRITVGSSSRPRFSMRATAQVTARRACRHRTDHGPYHGACPGKSTAGAVCWRRKAMEWSDVRDERYGTREAIELLAVCLVLMWSCSIRHATA